MTNTFDTTEVAIKVQGIETTIDFNAFPANVQDAIIVYGTRRYIQDRINSQAHAARQADDLFDAPDAYDTLLADMMDGVTSTRKAASTVDPLERFILTATRTVLQKNKAFAHDKRVYDAIPSDDQAARQDCLMEIFNAHESAIRPIAESLKASHDMLAALSLDADDDSDAA